MDHYSIIRKKKILKLIDSQNCDHLHKNVFLHPFFLIENKINFKTIIQKPGCIVLTGVGTIHQGI
jgi:hypothetical protein